MHDHHPMIAFVFQKFVANPAHILFALLIDRDARFDPGMYEQIVADQDRVLCIGQEIDMLARNAFQQHLSQMGIAARFGLVAADAIAFDGGHAADGDQRARRLWIATGGGDEDFLVISL